MAFARPRASIVKIVASVALLSAMGVWGAACSLNPQPIPPGVTDEFGANDASAGDGGFRAEDATAGGTGADAGEDLHDANGPNPPPSDGGLDGAAVTDSDAGDGGPRDAGDGG